MSIDNVAPMRTNVEEMRQHWIFCLVGTAACGVATYSAVSGGAFGAALFAAIAYFCLYPNRPSEVTARLALAEKAP